MTDRLKILAGFGVIYFVWGSTYFAIKVAIETLPPFLMMSMRFLLAGVILILFTLKQANLREELKNLKALLILAATMIFTGTGLMAWVELYVPSGVAALLVSISPIWMVFMEAATPGGVRPGILSIVGVLVGLGGTLMLIDPSSFSGDLPILPLAVLLLSSVSWSLGSIYARHKKVTLPPLRATAWQMVLGGVMLLFLAVPMGELSAIHLDQVSMESALAFGYLIFFGSLLVFPTYLWLIKETTPALVGTHSYVNPVVAVLLGWMFASEPLTLRMLIAGAIILASVFLITLDSKSSKQRFASFFKRRILRRV